MEIKFPRSDLYLPYLPRNQSAGVQRREILCRRGRIGQKLVQHSGQRLLPDFRHSYSYLLEVFLLFMGEITKYSGWKCVGSYLRDGCPYAPGLAARLNAHTQPISHTHSPVKHPCQQSFSNSIAAPKLRQKTEFSRE